MVIHHVGWFVVNVSCISICELNSGVSVSVLQPSKRVCMCVCARSVCSVSLFLQLNM